MKALAEFVMRGRLQAAVVAVLGAGTGLLFWISAAAVALTTLRKGTQEGMLLLVIAAASATVVAVGSSSPPLSLLTLLACYAGAVVLRSMVRWVPALLAVSMAGLVLAFVLQTGLADYLQQLLEHNRQLLSEMIESQNTDVRLTPEQKAEQKQTLATVESVMATMTVTQIAGLLATASSLMAALSLLLGRYWQAALYNPGGFREEFHALRLPWQAAALLVLLVILLVSSKEYVFWVGPLLVPMMITGVALVHNLVARLGQGRPLLIAFYLFFIMVGAVKELVIVLAIVDSIIDFRSRLGSGSGSNRT